MRVILSEWLGGEEYVGHPRSSDRPWEFRPSDEESMHEKTSFLLSPLTYDSYKGTKE